MTLRNIAAWPFGWSSGMFATQCSSGSSTTVHAAPHRSAIAPSASARKLKAGARERGERRDVVRHLAQDDVDDEAILVELRGLRQQRFHFVHRARRLERAEQAQHDPAPGADLEARMRCP